MKKKLTKIIFLVGFLLVSFFVSQKNVSATTIYSQDDFDSYVVSDPLSDYSNWFVNDWLRPSPIVSSDYYVSAGNSVKFSVHPDGGLAQIGYNFNNSLDSFYVSADILLEIPPESQYSGSTNLTFESYNDDKSDFVKFSCVKYHGYISGHVFHISANYGDNEIINQLCNGSFNNISVHFERDYLNNRTIISSYINGDLIGTTYESFSQLGFYNILIRSDVYLTNAYVDNFTISDTLLSNDPDPIDGVCGAANGSTFDWDDFDNQDFCSAGDFYLAGDSGERIIYHCAGLNGGTTQYNCSASYYYNGVCGSASGSSFSSLDVSSAGLCSSGYVSEGSFLESGSGWSWICSGSGSSSFCNATKSLISFPEMPEETDCSSLTFPDNLLCNIENLLKTGFLPSASALNNLNNAVNQIQQKAPFNYLNVAIEKIRNVKDNITSESISMSLMGNSSTLNINSLTSDFMPSVKSFFTLMIVFAFIFWGIAYIKHFFK